MKRNDVDALRALIAEGEATVVVGAGVAKATNKNAPTWTETVRQALEAALSHTQCPNERRRIKRQLNALRSLRIDLVTIAEKAGQALGTRDGPLWAQFVQEAFGVLEPIDRKLMNAIEKTKLRLATTNYDILVEKSLGFQSITSNQELRSYKRRPDKNSVIHLHGIYNNPTSIVWGKKDYKRLTSDILRGYFQNWISESGIIFIGCGGTLDDPNFTQWREFLAAVADHGAPAFRLYAGTDSHVASPHFISICYGQNHEDLVGFLRSITPWENYLSQPQLSELKDRDRSYESAASQLACRLLNHIPDTELIGRRNEVRARLKKFLRAHIRPIFFYIESKVFCISRHEFFPTPAHEEILCIYAEFCATIDLIDLKQLLIIFIDAYSENLLFPVIVTEVDQQEFSNHLWDKFLSGADKIDDGEARLSGEALRRREAAMQAFKKNFFSQPQFDRSVRSLENEWRRDVLDQHSLNDQFEVEDEADDFQGAHYAYEADFPRFNDVVGGNDDFYEELVLLAKSDVDPWANFVFNGSVVGTDEILIPDEAFRSMNPIHAYMIVDNFNGLCDELEALQSSADL